MTKNEIVHCAGLLPFPRARRRAGAGEATPSGEAQAEEKRAMLERCAKVIKPTETVGVGQALRLYLLHWFILSISWSHRSYMTDRIKCVE
jgi:hypothetical protein